MSYIIFHDVSQWQGNYNMNDGCPIVAIKMSGGDAGLYMDSQAANNYNHASALGKTILGYHFAGGTDPIAEADYFVRAMSPFAKYDIYALDWEVSNPDPVGWCSAFNNEVKSKTGCWPIIYMNTSTCLAHDWNPVLADSGLWIADYRYTPDQDVPCGHPYIIHQYTDSPLDTDACFIDIDTLKKYGYQGNQPVVVSSPPPSAPTAQPTPTQSTQISSPVPTQTKNVTLNNSPIVHKSSHDSPKEPVNLSFWQKLIQWFWSLFK